MESEMQKLATLAAIASVNSAGISTSTTHYEGRCGSVSFGIDAGGSHVEIDGKRMSDEDAQVLVANIVNSLSHLRYMAWHQDHYPKERLQWKK